VDIRYLDPLKLWVAAYYYNRAAEWGKQVSIVTKKAAYAPSGNNTNEIGSIVDFEKIGSRSPAGIRTGVWEVHEPIGSTWCYTSNMTVSPPATVISKLAIRSAGTATCSSIFRRKPMGQFPSPADDVARGGRMAANQWRSDLWHAQLGSGSAKAAVVDRPG